MGITVTTPFPVVLFNGWARALGGTGTQDWGWGVDLDSSNNLCVAGQTNSRGSPTIFQTEALVAKYTKEGTLLWQRAIGESIVDTGNDRGLTVAVDGSDDIYVVGSGQNTGIGAIDWLLLKYNSSGVLQYQRVYGTSSTEQPSQTIISGNDMYVVGSTSGAGAGNNDMLLVKFDISTTPASLTWERTLGHPGGGTVSDSGDGLGLDSSGNVFIVGQTFGSIGGPGAPDQIIAKYNSSGTLQAKQIYVGNPSGSERFNGAQVNNNDELIVFGYTTAGFGSWDAHLLKFDNSLNLIWQRALGGSGTDTIYGIAIDSSDNIYVTGTAGSAGGMLIAEYDTNGNLQWQRSLNAPVLFTNGYGIKYGNDGWLYFTGETDATGTQDLFVGRVRDDGSGTGTFTTALGDWTYLDAGLTEVTADGSPGALPQVGTPSPLLINGNQSLTYQLGTGLVEGPGGLTDTQLLP